MTEKKTVYQVLRDTCQHKSERKIVKKINSDLDGYVDKTIDLVVNGFIPNDPKRFVRRDPNNGKERDICSIPLWPDQAIHRLAIEVAKDPLTKGMDPFCVGCVPRRGCNAGLEAVRRFVEENKDKKIYVLKFDLRHFYESIDKEILFDKLNRRIKDIFFLAYLWNLLSINKKGLAIGVYSSPWLGNFYLQDIDHEIREKHKIRFLCRNVDDFVLMDFNKRKLKKCLEEIRESLKKLNLTIKDDWRLFPLSEGDIDFVGFRIHANGAVTIRKRNWKRLRRDCLVAKHHHLSQKRAKSLLSRMGNAKHSNGRKIFRGYLTSGIIKLAKKKAK